MDEKVQKIAIKPSFPMFQWWEYIPEYDLIKLWKKDPIEVQVDDVKAIYQRGTSYLFDVQREGSHFPLYLASVPSQFAHLRVEELGAVDTLKFLKKYKSKAPKFMFKILGLLFFVIILFRMFSSMHF